MFLPKENVGVYRIINLVNHKQYIGGTSDIRRRRRQHRYDLREGTHRNPRIQEDFDLYGENMFAFLVLEIVKDKSKLVETEQKWIDELQPEYNVNPKAGYCVGEYVNNKSAHEKISETIKRLHAEGRYAHIKGTKRNWKAGHPPNLGKKFSKETRAKISKATTGKNNPNYGKPRLASTRKKIGDANAKTYEGAVSPEGIVYSPIVNMSQFCKEHGLGLSSMVAVMRHRRNQHKGWRRV